MSDLITIRRWCIPFSSSSPKHICFLCEKINGDSSLKDVVCYMYLSEIYFCCTHMKEIETDSIEGNIENLKKIKEKYNL